MTHHLPIKLLEIPPFSGLDLMIEYHGMVSENHDLILQAHSDWKRQFLSAGPASACSCSLLDTAEIKKVLRTAITVLNGTQQLLKTTQPFYFRNPVLGIPERVREG